MRNIFYAVLANFLLLVCSLSVAQAQWTPRNPVKSFQKQADGVVFTMETGTLKVQVCTDSIVHVLYSPTTSFNEHPDYVILKKNWPAVSWEVQSTDNDVTITT